MTLVKKQRKTFPNIKLSKTEELKDLSLNNSMEYRKESKPKLPWSIQEIAALNAGVEKYGLKKWKRILSKFNTVFNGRRRVVDLASKYRLLNAKSSYYNTIKRDWIMVNENNNPEEDAMGEVISIFTKFPYDAAKRMAKKKVRNGELSFIIRIREGTDLNNVHAYSGSKIGNGKLTLKKLALNRTKD